MMTQERANILTSILNADQERTCHLLSLDASDAMAQINALGNDFTLDEITEYGEAIRASVAQGELDSTALDGVAGGLGPLAIAGLIAGGTYLVGVGVGVAQALGW